MVVPLINGIGILSLSPTYGCVSFSGADSRSEVLTGTEDNRNPLPKYSFLTNIHLQPGP
jgi:hypothetical protein